MSKYTSGPWTVDESGLNVMCPDGSGLFGSRDTEEKMANAKLIAAAPEMAEALSMMQKALDELMPGVGKIVVQDFAILNDAPIAASRALNKAGIKI